MKKKYILIPLYFISSLLLIANTAEDIITTERIFEIDDRQRVYYLHLPENLVPNAPLVFTLHGYGGDAKSMIEQAKMNAVADKNGFAVCYTSEDPSAQWRAMRIRDLLTMNTGHIIEPTVWFSDGDWVKFFMGTEVPLMPGTHFKYNSSATYMLSAILQKVTGEKLVDYLTPRLFEPLQIKKPRWDVCPKGINTGGWGLSITTEDIAKLGQFYLQKGQWNGQQLLSKQLIEIATSKQVSNGSDPNNDWNQGYGFQFWQCRHNAYRGDGAMGQYCIVIPELDAVVAITSGVYDMGHVMTLVWEELSDHLHSLTVNMDSYKGA